MADPIIDRDEVVGLLFNVGDMVALLSKIVRLLEENDGEEEADED